MTFARRGLDYSPVKLAIGGAVLFFSYFTFLPVTGAIDEHHIRELEAILKRIPVAYQVVKYLLMYENMVFKLLFGPARKSND